MSNSKTDLLYPVLTHTELLGLIHELSLIFDVVRTVDAGLQRVLTYDADSNCTLSEFHCYDVWNKTQRCQNCISSLAFKNKTRLTKFEFVGNDIFYVTSQYIVVDDSPCLLEIVEKVSDLALSGAFGKEAFIERISQYTDRIYKDSLTDVYNRRYYDEQIKFLRMNSVAMIDMDHFKDINDTYGHVCGDAVLTAVGRVLQACVRGQDSLIRYGGDEFLIAFAEISKEELEKELEYIRQSLEKIRLEDYPHVRVSASIGAAFGEGPVYKSMLIADHALYHAKIKRNCFCIYDTNHPE